MKFVPECEGCSKLSMGECLTYAIPAAKWRTGKCPLHPSAFVKEVIEKKKLNSLKASKRREKQ